MTAPLFDRAAAGQSLLERELGLSAWSSANAYPADQWSLERLLAVKRESVSVVLPAREVADTIECVVATLFPLREAGLVDELVVVDAASGDGTAATAAEHGATVVQESGLLRGFGPALGKGDAMWRGLAATAGEIVVYIDTDTRDFDERFLLGLLGPLLERPEIEFVKGAFRRPFKVEGSAAVPDGGGRVTELVARPVINLFAPELAGFAQPLAGETAGRRALLESISYPVGYGVEIAMMLDVVARCGLGAMAQVDLGTRQNRHQSLHELGAMAYAVLAAATRRVHGAEAIDAARGAGTLTLPGADGPEVREIPLTERPPVGSLPPEERAEALAVAAAGRAAADTSTNPGQTAVGAGRTGPTSGRFSASGSR